MTEQTALDLSGSPLSDTELESLSKQDGLTSLSLEGTQVGDAGLARLSGLSHLQVLNLAGTPVTDAGLAHVAQLSELRILVLKNTAVTDAGLTSLQTLSVLQTLNLEGTQVTAQGLQWLQQVLPQTTILPQVEQPLVQTDPFTAAPATPAPANDASASAESPGFQRLHELKAKIDSDQQQNVIRVDLGRSDVSDDDLALFAEFPKLTELDLSRTAVTDVGLDHLHALKKLRRLNLRRTKTSRLGVRRLRRSLRRCKVKRGFWRRLLWVFGGLFHSGADAVRRCRSATGRLVHKVDSALLRRAGDDRIMLWELRAAVIAAVLVPIAIILWLVC